LSRTKIRTIIEQQVSFVDGRRARPSSGVRGGETILLDRPAPREPPVPRDFRILYEEPGFMAIDKPAGLPMHTTAKFWRNTLAAVLRERFPDQPVQMCHRLDREPSGVLLLARDSESASALKQAFARRWVSKVYLALVRGVPAAAEGVVDRPMKLLR